VLNLLQARAEEEAQQRAHRHRSRLRSTRTAGGPSHIIGPSVTGRRTSKGDDMRALTRLFLVSIVGLASGRAVMAQTEQALPRQVTVQTDVPLPPATKLEGFLPAPGSVVTVGFDPLRGLQSVAGVNVEVRDVHDDHGDGARGLVIRVTEGETRRDFSYVDAEEVPSLLAGIDALLQVGTNPTPFAMFEVRYATRGELEFTVFNNPRGEIVYAVQAGRTVRAQRVLSTADMSRLRGLLDAAQAKLAATRPR
jgi:hypothetical protein